MKKQELSDLLHSLQIPVNEGIASQENTNKYPRVVYWDYIWRIFWHLEKSTKMWKHTRLASILVRRGMKN